MSETIEGTHLVKGTDLEDLVIHFYEITDYNDLENVTLYKNENAENNFTLETIKYIKYDNYKKISDEEFNELNEILKDKIKIKLDDKSKNIKTGFLSDKYNLIINFKHRTLDIYIKKEKIKKKYTLIFNNFKLNIENDLKELNLFKINTEYSVMDSQYRGGKNTKKIKQTKKEKIKQNKTNKKRKNRKRKSHKK